jgi:glyoxylase-like metal-dependent hydrolase (beta-lactamase superfamily II)
VTRILTSVLGNAQRLDGGAMFGNAPRAVWERWIEPDAANRIPLACRCLLIRDAGRTILLETGIGAFFPPKLRDRYGVLEDRHVLLDSLAAAGVAPADVDVVVLSHLHFDHAGGALTAYRDGADPALAFPRARFVIGAEAWARAQAPHPRDRASFVPALNALLAALPADRLEIVDGDRSAALGAGYRFHRSEGHTPGLLLTEIEMPGGPIVFAADLIPGQAWVHVPITMGYDRYPERLIDEKQALLTELAARRGRLFFTHDAAIALATVDRAPDGRFTTVDPVASFTALAS